MAATNGVIPPRFFGLHGMGFGANGIPVPAKPYGLFRTWDHWGSGNITWAGLEPSKGQFNWPAMDKVVDTLKDEKVDILHCFGKTPSWAAARQTDPPSNIQDWDDFITAFVTRYHTRIKYLEVWNEAMEGEGFYTGTLPQLVQLAQHLYTIAKSIDPTVTILTPDATGGWQNMQKFYSDYFAAGGGAYADAVAFHGYCSMAGANQITYPEEIIRIVTALKGAMAAHGQGAKPIFDTEGDWGSTGNAPTSDDRVGFLARHYLLQWSLGVSSYAWYCWDNNNGIDQWGQLWTPDGGLNAAGIAYQELYDWMVGATMTQPCVAQGSTFTCELTRPGGYQALAVWSTNRTGASSFPVPKGYVYCRDLSGNTHPINGATVAIGVVPILLENAKGTIRTNRTRIEAAKISTVEGANAGGTPAMRGLSENPRWMGVFKTSADTDPWINAGQAAKVSASFTNDCPPAEAISSGSLLFQGTFGPTASFGGLQKNIGSVNLSNYSHFELDVKIVRPRNERPSAGSFQPVFGIGNSLTWNQSSIQPQLANVNTNSGWQHIVIPLSAFPMGLSDVRQIFLLIYDGSYSSPQTVQLEFANIAFTCTNTVARAE